MADVKIITFGGATLQLVTEQRVRYMVESNEHLFLNQISN